MKRKPVTLTEDLDRLINGGILGGEFSDRSDAVRQCLLWYFRSNLSMTAALLVAHDEIEIDSVAEVLEVDRQQLEQMVASIRGEEHTVTSDTYLSNILNEFDEFDSDRTTVSPDERGSSPDE